MRQRERETEREREREYKYNNQFRNNNNISVPFTRPKMVENEWTGEKTVEKCVTEKAFRVVGGDNAVQQIFQGLSSLFIKAIRISHEFNQRL